MTLKIVLCKILIILSATILLSCKNTHQEQTISSSKKGDIVQTDSLNQIKMVDENFIQTKGEIKLHPNGIVYVSVPIGGILIKVYNNQGDQIKKGDRIAILEHPDYLKIQQEFLEVKSKITFLENNYKRLGELTLEDAVSIKKLQQAQSEFLGLEAKYYSLKAQLRLLNFNPEDISPEKLSSRIYIYAPGSGIINAITAHPGKYVDNENSIMEIVDPTQIYIELKINSSDFSRIKVNQRIEYANICEPQNKGNGRIVSFGPVVEKKSNLFIANGELEKYSECLKPGLQVDAIIFSESLEEVN